MKGLRESPFFMSKMIESATAGAKGLEKTFDPAHFEERWYARWEADGHFQPSGPPGSPRFVMVIPPPNVTGRLHIGHAYGRTVEDILARWKRMRGHRVLWVPGTDHAGIATQMVVERQLARLEPPALHDGSRPLPRGPPRLRAPLPGRPDLQGAIRRQLVSRLRHRRLGPRGGGEGDARHALPDPVRR